MSDDADLDGPPLRPSVRPWLIAGAVNVAVGAVLLGVPYFRGPSRAAEVPARWAAFAACFYQAEALQPPGLGLPAGARGRYATLVLTGPPDWPARCRAPLAAIPADESMFLFPNVKNAEARVRAAVELLDGQLAALAERRASPDRRVPDRPARAVEQLRGALAELGLASGVAALGASRDAIALPDAPSLPVASIVPLRVSEGRAWTVAVERGAVLASTLDARAVVGVRVSSDGVEQRVTRRPGLVGALLGAGPTPWAVFSTPASGCAEDRCVHRTSGLAALLEDRQTLEPMAWLPAHPLGAPGRSVHVEGRVAHVLAPHGDAGARVLRFALPEPTVRALGEARDAPHLDAEAEWPLDAAEASALVWIAGAPLRLAHAREGAAGVVALAPGEAEVRFAPPPGRLPQIAACGGWIAMASDQAASVRALDGAFEHRLALRVRPPVPERLRVVCEGDAIEVWTLDERALSRARCMPEGCGAPARVAAGVAAFDVVAHAGAIVLAETDATDEGAVRVTSWAGGAERTFVASPCWSDPPDGLCGEPRLATDGRTLALVTRQGEDLRVVTSEDGLTFTHLVGLAQR